MLLRMRRVDRGPTDTGDSTDVSTLEELVAHLEAMAAQGISAVEVSLAPTLLKQHGVSLLGLELRKDESQSWTVVTELHPSLRAG